MSDRHPAIVNLQLHEQNQQQIIYEEGEEMEALVRAQTNHTTLTAYFETVANELIQPLPPEKIGQDPTTGQQYPTASELTYIDFPTFYTWDTKKKNGLEGKGQKNLTVLVAFTLLIQLLVKGFTSECCCVK